MDILLEVPDKDAARVLELIKGIKRVKIKSVRQAAKARVLNELREALLEVKKIERGETPAPTRTLEDLLDELDAEAATAT